MRIIDADALLDLVQFRTPIDNHNAEVISGCVDITRRLIEAAPTIDPEELRPKGRWEHLGGDEWCCTNCGFVITTEGSWETPEKKFCEDCGAKMQN